jgi:hypothetical protein
VEAIGALATKPPLEQAANASLAIRLGLAHARDQGGAVQWAEAANQLLQSKTPVEHVADVIDLFKYPTAAGTPTDILISGLRKRFDVPLGDLQEVTSWIEKEFPELKLQLSSPPKRPRAPARQG